MYNNIFMQECPECRDDSFNDSCLGCGGKRVVPTDQGEMILEFLREFGEVPKQHFHGEYELKHMIYGGKG